MILKRLVLCLFVFSTGPICRGGGGDAAENVAAADLSTNRDERTREAQDVDDIII